MSQIRQENDSGAGGFFVNFNQDSTSLAVGTKVCYRLFSLSSVDRLDLIYESTSELDEDACLVERLFSSSLVAVVSLSSPRKLKVCHFKKGTEICNYSYSNTILAVKLNRARLVVCLEESLYIHNIRDMKVLHTIRDTPSNPQGLCALSPNSNEHCYLAYPGSATIGEVQIFDAYNLQAKTMIPAHDSPLAAIAFSITGTLIATASEKGTVIRIFRVDDGARLHEFRRGVKRCATIYSLAFSADSQYLAASSNTETVHIFKLEDPQRPGSSSEEPQGWMGYLSKAVSVSASYLPTQVADVFSQGRAFATVHLPFQGIRNVCSLATIQKVMRLLIASAEGYVYVYEVNPVEGGDCTLLKQHRLDGLIENGTENSHSDGYSGAHGKAKLDAAGSYALIVRGRPFSQMTADCLPDSEKFHDMERATETPPANPLRLDDEGEFPPMTQKLD
ncbi:WD repeat domain phosphoinositide-interacting protein 2-like isoform X1 [Daphnia pulicaria]|uniref:WD repeat domain phosphoinositide-interacting protein 2-like isoform X1 n=1 Tax=Daphnia pulicaria TaxID=35523 RepID=UPI001EECCE3E|nr:WD repeat domain phosphoinositide-interacting protein 2-like isoform X1 [Daphnia pulicaria]